MIEIDARIRDNAAWCRFFLRMAHEIRKTERLSHRVRIRVDDGDEVELQITFKKGTSRRNSSALDDEHSPRAGS